MFRRPSTSPHARLLAAVAGCVLTAAALVGVAAPAQAIYGGQSVDPSAFRFLVMLSSPKLLRCGGSLVAPDIVLTAAHCVAGDAGPYTVTFHFGQPDAYQVGLSAPPIANPGFQAGGTDDVAVLRLNRAVSEPTIAISDTEPPIGTAFTAAGYGCTTAITKRCKLPTTLRLMSATVVADTSCPLDDGTSHLCGHSASAQAEPGDSGGPLIWQVGGVQMLGGIVATAYTTGGLNNGYTSTAVELPWIRSAMAGAAAAPATG
jgi:secreted trypsin-like serine protease